MVQRWKKLILSLFWWLPQGDSFVLDMCAAPGSKTSQLLEALHNAAERERSNLSGVAREWPTIPGVPFHACIST